MNRSLTFLLCCLAILPGSHAADQPNGWSATCDLDGHPFSLDFRSASGDPFEDDMQISLLRADGTPQPLPIPAALYHPAGSASNVPGLCAGTDGDYSAALTAHDVGDGLVLLWLRKDGRPSFDTLTLALLDVQAGTLVDLMETGREIKDSDGQQRLAIQRNAEGFRVRLVGEWLQNTGTDSAENAIETWVPVEIAQRRIRLDGAGQ